MKTTFDCIVVGAGPAGSSIAYHLARENIDVLLLDSNAHPRSKPCGGGLTVRARRLLHVDVSQVIEKDINHMVITCSYENPVFLETPEPFAYMLMRDKFDHLLLNAARSSGAECLEQCTASSIEIAPHEVVVQTSHGTFTAKILVGADGANGITYKVLNPNLKRNLAFCIEGTTLPNVLPNIPYKDSVFLTYGNIRHGYGWMFPKRDNFSLGVGTFNKNPDIKKYFTNHLSTVGVPDDSSAIHVAAHPIPLFTKGFRISGERVILLGDAAGLGDPLSGEGLYAALKTAELGAECVRDALRNGEFSMAPYAQLVKSTMLPELRSAQLVAKLFYSFPKLFHKIFQVSPKLLYDYFKVISNANSYSALYDSVKKEVPPV